MGRLCGAGGLEEDRPQQLAAVRGEQGARSWTAHRPGLEGERVEDQQLPRLPQEVAGHVPWDRGGRLQEVGEGPGH